MDPETFADFRWYHWIVVLVGGLVQCVLATAVLWFFLGLLPSIQP